jgi:hypothetical protein
MKRLVFSTEAQVKVLEEASGTFSVKSERSCDEYKVYLVSPHDNSVPSCECADWQQNYLPCKHILAVIQSSKNSLGWEDMPLEYRESPYISLDVDILFQPIDSQQPKQSEKILNPVLNAPLPTTTPTGSVSTEIPKKVYPKRTNVTRCCDLLARIKNLTHECTNAEVLKTLEQSLKTVLKDLEAGCESASGIILTSDTTATGSVSTDLPGNKRKKKQAAKSNVASKKLKLAQTKKRHLYNNRVGQKAQNMKKFFKTNMPLEEMTNTQANTIDSPFECNDDSNKHNSSNYPTSRVHFTPVIRKRSNLRETMLKNGPHNVSLLQLKSLEPFLPRGTEILLLSICESFSPGWLFDEIINSFFWCLQGRYQNITYASSTSMLALQKQSPSRLLWKNIDISTKKYIFAPWNPTDHHWTLVVVDIQQQKIIYLDPFQMEVNSGYLKLLATFMPQVLFTKFGFSGFQLESPPHTLQTDLKSCGVLVCWYALQIVQGKPITDSCNEYAIRAAIYDEIRGNCMKRRSGLPYVELLKCTECQLPVNDDKIECGRCFQQYHLGCIKQAIGTVTEVNFYCPPYDLC